MKPQLEDENGAYDIEDIHSMEKQIKALELQNAELTADCILLARGVNKAKIGVMSTGVRKYLNELSNSTPQQSLRRLKLETVNELILFADLTRNKEPESFRGRVLEYRQQMEKNETN